MVIKNSNIRRMLNKNRYQILIIIIAIILFFLIKGLLNQIAKQNLAQTANQVDINNTVISQTPNKPEETLIVGKDIQKEEQVKNEEIIKQFVTYCNEQKIEQAYNLLTDECKEVVFYSNIENFKKNYVERIFTTTKIYHLQSWMNYYATTYRIRILDDILSTGQSADVENTIEDYYTIVQVGNQYKLNINGYIGRIALGYMQEQDGITITLGYKDMFKEYETYQIECKNTTSNSIALDSKEKLDTTYLIGSNDSHYTAFTYEIEDTRLVIPPRTTKKISIRFNKIYSNQVVMRRMQLSDIILNYETYENTQDKKTYENRTKMSIELK